jgi:hypothetical protein
MDLPPLAIAVQQIVERAVDQRYLACCFETLDSSSFCSTRRNEAQMTDRLLHPRGWLLQNEPTKIDREAIDAMLRRRIFLLARFLAGAALGFQNFVFHPKSSESVETRPADCGAC